MLNSSDLQFIAANLPFFGQLSAEETDLVTRYCVLHHLNKNVIFHHGMEDCSGFILLRRGAVRAFILSESGREISLYRLNPGDSCLLTSACSLNQMDYNISLQAEKASDLFIIPPDIFSNLADSNPAVKSYSLELMSKRLQQVMWVLENTLFTSLDKRLSSFLLEQARQEKSLTLHLTHEAIASYLGTAREVVTRMLNYFHEEGLVSLSRGQVTLQDPEGLKALSK